MTRLERLGRFEARHAKVVVAAWVVAVAAAFAVALGGLGGASLFDRLSSGQPDVPGESQTARQLLDAQGNEGTRVLVVIDGVDPAAPAVRSGVASLARTLAAGDEVAAVRTPWTPEPASALIARDGHGLAVVVELRPDLPARVESRRADWVAAQAASALSALPDAKVTTGSTPQLVDEVTHQLEVDLRTGEGVALPISLLVMVLVFGGFIAAGLPIAGAIASIAGGLAALWIFVQFIDLDATVVNVVTIMGLGLCIDYGLLVVSRFREELRRLGDVELALGRTVAIAGRTVLFSALIVAICLCGLLVFRAPILRALGAAGVSVVIVALLVGLTLVPALVGLAGKRLIRPGLPTRVPGLRAVLARLGDVAPDEGAFSRLARVVQRRPWWVAVGVTALLLVGAVPALGMHLRSSGPDLMPVGSPQRDFFDRLDDRFPALAGPDITVVTRGTTAQVTAWAESVAEIPGVADVVPPRVEGSLVVLGVHVVGGDSGGERAADVVRALRADRPPFPTWVTGQAAGQIDFTSDIAKRAPWAIALVMLVTFVLLFLMTGSVLVPVKALAMNVVSLGASLGVVTWIFQDGHLSGLLSFTSTGGVETTVPPLVLAFGFGLAMDYEVFLLSRIKEQHDAGARGGRAIGNDAAVAAGLQHSGRIITSAALLIVIVFAGLITGRVLVVKQTGVALTVAVAIDATLVRMLLVPATMTLLGEWNWWAPGPLRRLHDRFGIRAH